ncbi:bifunctional nicotinamidase/pyrazinamidase [Enhygromyxa salina]|uniref:Nicotinamidase n=1 Tax=Enhygromyxa salina TaxID=215803 RepID=A0A2S9XL52_9BACT|nr:bifunctional nicotinamidase/pyrazinamidase [Enhygromyxa salina]PRP93567.1 ADP-ribose pyrophosphatase [Enhygromyxa salina]
MSTKPKRALIIVDLQPDFLPGGPLGVSGGDEIIPTVIELMSRFEIVVATQDWHPPDHGSFAANHPGRSPGEVIDLDGLQQVLWPVHCVQASDGAELVPELRALPPGAKLDAVFRKGTDSQIDSYSGFFDNGHRKPTGLAQWLAERGVGSVAVCGLALDYCVKFTALDALELGLETTLIRDATRAVNLQPGDDERAMQAIAAAGGKLIDSAAILSEPAAAMPEYPEPELIAAGKWLRLVRRGRWEYCQRTVGGTAALIVAVTSDNELILVEQPRPAVAGMCIELPAGLVGDNAGSEHEAPELAAARELEEETGYTPTRLELVAQGTSSPGLSDEHLIFYVAHGVTKIGPGGGDAHEDITVHLVPLDEVEAWLIAQQAAGRVIDLKVWSGLYFARRAAAGG